MCSSICEPKLVMLVGGNYALLRGKRRALAVDVSKYTCWKRA